MGEAGLETARRAVICGLSDETRAEYGLVCPDSRIADLNSGFIRDKADLVVIFVSDEDDCSFMDESVYERPTNSAERREGIELLALLRRQA